MITQAKAGDTLPATVRIEKERQLEAMMMAKEDHTKGEIEKALATKYHKVKFFERVKVDRKLQQTLKKLEEPGLEAEEYGALLSLAAKPP